MTQTCKYHKKVFEPYFQSSKVYVPGHIHDIRVGMRNVKVKLDNESEPIAIALYDTSGPYTDNQYSIDFEKGLPKTRLNWIENRFDTQPVDYSVISHSRNRTMHGKNWVFEFNPRIAKPGKVVTQQFYARQGIITPEMEYVAIREQQKVVERFEELKKRFGFSIHLTEVAENKITPEFVREEIAAGRAIIPANINHPESEPMIIGKNFLTKINANLGNSTLSSGMNEELEKALWAIRWGADTIMDLSTGKYISEIREKIIRNSPIPVGTVPIYEAFERVGGDIKQLSWEVYRDVLLLQCLQGVDYFTIHAGLLKKHIPYAIKRTTGIVSRGGAIMAQWCTVHNKENFLYTHFEEICKLLSQFDVAISLGDGLRPGSISDANDYAQFAELEVLGELVKIANKYHIQVMIEGPGHVPLQLIRENVIMHQKFCGDTPFYTLGPLVTDVAAGYDHIASAIGGSLIAMKGVSLLCYVTCKEHLGLPVKEDVREGIVTFKIAAHAANMAKGFFAEYLRDLAMSKARFNFQWNDQFALALDPDKAMQFYHGALPENEVDKNYCSMCGENFCSMRTTQKIQTISN